jgi:ABC-type antimicrobial peptide transport system permease subunit
VARLIAREIAVVTLLGISAGLFASYFAGRLLATRVFELSVSDPLTLFAAAVVMLGITMTAAALPTVRATRIEPMTAIRYE